MNILSLFSGIGGLELGLERAGMTVVGQVEIDPFCRRVLAKHWPNVPRHDDVRTAADWWLSEERPHVDLICGGFPCQDISTAGRRVGINGERSGLWSFMADTVRQLRPRYVLMENVAAILVRGLDTVAADLAEIGYDLWWDCLPAAAVGAPHRRDRWFGVAYPQRSELRLEPVTERRGSDTPIAGHNGTARPVADPEGFSESLRAAEGQRLGRPTSSSPTVADTDREPMGWAAIPRRQRDHWAVEPDVGRVANGIPNRVDRLKALGNAVVPQVAQHIGELIMAVAA